MNKNPTNTVFDAKRLIGLKYSSETVQNDKKLWPFKVIADAKDRIQIEVLDEGVTQKYYPEQISALVLKEMKRIASTYLGYQVTDAVITVPAYFN